MRARISHHRTATSQTLALTNTPPPYISAPSTFSLPNSPLHSALLSPLLVQSAIIKSNFLFLKFLPGLFLCQPAVFLFHLPSLSLASDRPRASLPPLPPPARTYRVRARRTVPERGASEPAPPPASQCISRAAPLWVCVRVPRSLTLSAHRVVLFSR